MKVLISADIHIDDYTRYNPSPKWRLGQFDRLARRLNDIAFNEGCKEIWLAGDITNKAVPAPDVLHSIRNFLSILKGRAISIRFIRGQHDQYGKISNQVVEDSVINVFPELATYMDHQIMKIDGHTFAFMNYYRKQDLSWIPDKVDVLIGHCSITFGQDWDRKKFKMAFFGDIHKEFEDGNCISIGNPIQHKIDDQESGSVIILDTETLKWYRVPVDKSHSRFLRVRYTEEGSGYDGKLTWEVKKSSKPKIVSAKEVVKIEGTVSYNEILIQTLEQNKLMEIHEEMKKLASGYNPINFGFKLNDIHIHNVKGIHDLKYSFDGNLMIVGRNGSGKTSFILSIFQLITGSMDWDRLQRRGKSEAYVEGNLTYEGHQVYIKRSASDNHLKIDGKEISYKDKRDFQNVVTTYLPFTKYHTAYYFNYWARELLGDNNNSLKLRIISKFNGLDIFDHLSKVASAQIDIFSDKLKDSQRKVDNLKSSIESASKKIEDRENSIPKGFDPIMVDLYTTKCMLISSILKTKSMRDKIASIEHKLEGHTIESINEKMRELESELKDDKRYLEVLEETRLKGKERKMKLDRASENYEKLKNNPDTCPTCHQKIDAASYSKHLEEAKKEYQHQFDKHEIILKEYTDLKKNKESTNNRIIEIKDELENLRGLLNEFDKLKMLKDELSNLNAQSSDVIIMFDPSESDLEYAKSQLSDAKKYYGASYGLADLKSMLNGYQSDLENARSIRDQHKDHLNALKKYAGIISKDGVIYEGILKELLEKLSNDMFKFSVKSEVGRSGRQLIISIKFYKESEGVWKHYEDCSQGEKSLCDTYFLYRLLNGSGLIVFDEYYSHVDDDYLPIICDYLNNMDVGSIIISTHSNNMVLNATTLLFPIEQ